MHLRLPQSPQVTRASERTSHPTWSLPTEWDRRPSDGDDTKPPHISALTVPIKDRWVVIQEWPTSKTLFQNLRLLSKRSNKRTLGICDEGTSLKTPLSADIPVFNTRPNLHLLFLNSAQLLRCTALQETGRRGRPLGASRGTWPTGVHGCEGPDGPPGRAGCRPAEQAPQYAGSLPDAWAAPTGETRRPLLPPPCARLLTVSPALRTFRHAALRPACAFSTARGGKTAVLLCRRGTKRSTGNIPHAGATSNTAPHVGQRVRPSTPTRRTRPGPVGPGENSHPDSP